MKKKKLDIVILVLIVSVMILMFIPKGVGLKFASKNDLGETIYTYNFSSYFSMLPFGYAVFSPLLAAFSTTILLILSSIKLIFKQRMMHVWLIVTSLAATYFSILSVNFDPNLLTTISIIIMVVVTLITILLSYQLYMYHRQKRINH